jgi:hypothetical protein
MRTNPNALPYAFFVILAIIVIAGLLRMIWEYI